MSEPPVEREGSTEMTLDLIRYEVGNTARFLNYTPPGAISGTKRCRENSSIEDKERLIEKLGQHLESRYLRHCDMAIPLQWVAVNVARLVSTSEGSILLYALTNNIHRYWRRCGLLYTIPLRGLMEAPVFHKKPKIGYFAHLLM